VVGQATPLRTAEGSDRVQELQAHVAAVVNGDPGTKVLQKLALLCLENPVTEPPSPPLSPDLDLVASPSPFNPQSLPSLHSEMWDANKNFDRLFRALMQFLDPAKVIVCYVVKDTNTHTFQSEEELEYGLIIIWEMLENQAPYLEGKEADLFSVLFRVRYCNKLNVRAQYPSRTFH
jgi:CLIP-associating protein 1/2